VRKKGPNPVKKGWRKRNAVRSEDFSRKSLIWGRALEAIKKGGREEDVEKRGQLWNHVF